MQRIGFESFFNLVVETTWYEKFLNLALDEIRDLPSGSGVLDIGTGAGKLLELIQQNLDLNCVGLDINEAMLAHAKKRLSNKNTLLLQIKPGKPLPFENNEFDAVCLCSVLFLLENPNHLLDEAIRVLRQNGKIIVLTPTGKGNIKSSFALYRQLKFHVNNWTFFVWKSATAKSARIWSKQNYLPNFAQRNNLHYKKGVGLNNHAIVEVLYRKVL